MEYLKAFTIGTSGFVTYSLLSDIAFDKKYKYSKYYSFIIPIFYGLMTMFSVYIGNIFNLSLKLRLFIISIISIIIIIIFNYYVNKYTNYYKDKLNLLFIIIRDIINQLIVFNIIIFYFITNFSKSESLKIFIIGSSIFSYLVTYIKVYFKDNKQLNNYDYKYFTITEPFVQGIGLVIGLYILQHIFKYKLIKSLILYTIIISSILMAFTANSFKLYTPRP